ncbi:hypothetical protein BJ742DRAFT_672393, partial [Cladochytrium replicatum]
ELDDFDEQIKELLDAVRKTLEKDIPTLKGAERLEKCTYLKHRLGRAKQVHRSILVEMRELPPGPAAAEWEIKAKAYDATISKLLQDVEWAETSVERDDAKKRPVEEMATKEITTQALQLQEKTQEKTSRIRGIVEETIQIGTAVNEELKSQGEQLKNIQGNVEQVESNLKRADKQMRVFMRRMATDKIFLLLIFLVILGIIASIILRVLRDNGIS